MVKKKLVLILLILLAVILLIPYLKQSAQAESFKELPTGTVSVGAGEKFATVGGWNLIEFWHYSGGYWKATTRTSNGLKELIIYDYEVINDVWVDPNILMQKIYENGFVLEYIIEHPANVVNAINEGKTVTPVLNIDSETIRHSSRDIICENFFNYGQLMEGLSLDLPKIPEYLLTDGNIIIRALPVLN